MKFLFFFFLTVFSLVSVKAQVYEYAASIGDFKNAASFDISPAGFIYITDGGTNQILKLDTLGNLIKENGGFGWDNGTFDQPAGIYATALNVFVCDKNNHRVQFFDKDLNYLSQLKTRDSGDPELVFGYPLSVTVNKQGDLFVLDSENHRVLKFDLFGNFILNFGGFNYGKFSLNDPGRLSADPYNNIFVADGNRIVIFDPYGTGVTSIEAPGSITDLNILFDKLSLIAGNKIFSARIGVEEMHLTPVRLNNYEGEKNLVGSILYNNKLYVLTPTQIDIFTGTAN